MEGEASIDGWRKGRMTVREGRWPGRGERAGTTSESEPISKPADKPERERHNNTDTNNTHGDKIERQ